MKNNLFKSSNAYSSYSTENKYKKEVSIKINDEEFPSLTSESLCPEKKTSVMNYINASTIEEEIKPEKMKAGWTYIRFNKGKIQFNPPIIEKELPSIHIQMHNVVNDLESSWQEYKTKYIELYGEDCYNHMYEMPRIDYKIYEDCSEDDDYDSNDDYDNDDYDEYSSYCDYDDRYN